MKKNLNLEEARNFKFIIPKMDKAKVDTSDAACAVACMLVSNPKGELRQDGDGWQKRVNDLIRALRDERNALRSAVQAREAEGRESGDAGAFKGEIKMIDNATWTAKLDNMSDADLANELSNCGWHGVLAETPGDILCHAAAKRLRSLLYRRTLGANDDIGPTVQAGGAEGREKTE